VDRAEHVHTHKLEQTGIDAGHRTRLSCVLVQHALLGDRVEHERHIRSCRPSERWRSRNA
jgi:hypothetical protein